MRLSVPLTSGSQAALSTCTLSTGCWLNSPCSLMPPAGFQPWECCPLLGPLNNGLQRYQCPNLQNVHVQKSLTWQKGLYRHDCDLKMGTLSRIIQWAQCNYKGSYKWETRRSESRTAGVTTEAEVRVIWGHEPRNTKSLEKLEKARTQALPGASRKEGTPDNTLILAHKAHFRILVPKTVR